MRAGEVALIEVVGFCGYKAAGDGLLLTVERVTLVSGKGVTVAEAPLVLVQPPPSELWLWGAGSG
jgi:hypothetical protein